MRTRALLLTAGCVVLGLHGCGSDPQTVPTAEVLAGRLLTPDDLGDGWSVAGPPEGVAGAGWGVVTAEMQEMLPRFDLREAASAEARAAVTDIEWDAFMQLELDTGDPIEPPGDQRGHLVMLQEYLMGDDAGDVATTFGLMRTGSDACLGDFPADEEGPGRVETMAVPDLGDDRFGVLMVVEELGGWAEWRLHHVVVRDGPVLVNLVITDIRAGDGVEPFYTFDDIGEIARLAVERV